MVLAGERKSYAIDRPNKLQNSTESVLHRAVRTLTHSRRCMHEGLELIRDRCFPTPFLKQGFADADDHKQVKSTCVELPRT